MTYVLIYQSSSSASPKRPPPLLPLPPSSPPPSPQRHQWQQQLRQLQVTYSNTFLTSSRSSSAAGLHQNLRNVLITKELGEKHGPVRLNSDVGSLQEL